MTTRKPNPTLDQRAAELATSANANGWAVADLALWAKRKQEPQWAERVSAPFAWGKRWAQALARAAEFCEVDCVKTLKPRQHLRITHWVELASYWNRVDLEPLLEIADDAIAESNGVPITVDALKAKLFETFGERNQLPAARWFAQQSQQAYSFGERLGKGHRLYKRVQACAAEMKAIAEEINK